MALPDRRPSDIRRTLRQALEGQVLTGDTAKPLPMTVTLNQAEDDQDAGLGAYEAVDGGFLVKLLSGNTIGIFNGDEPDPEDVLQFHWQHNVSIEFCYSVDGVSGEVLQNDTLLLLEEATMLVRRALNPAGVNPQHNIVSLSYAAPVRHPKSLGFYIQKLGVRVNEIW